MTGRAGAPASRSTAGEADARLERVVAELLERVATIERQLAAPTAPGAADGPAPGPAQDGTAHDGTAPEDGPEDGPEDELWALHALQRRLPGGTGAVLLTGAVPLAGGGRALWQEGRPTAALLDADLDAVAARLSALASPVRLRLLREVLAGRTGSGELAADPQFGTTGQVQHHLRQLVAAGWLRPTVRGHYEVPVERVVPLLVAWAAAGR